MIPWVYLPVLGLPVTQMLLVVVLGVPFLASRRYAHSGQGKQQQQANLRRQCNPMLIGLHSERVKHHRFECQNLIGLAP